MKRLTPLVLVLGALGCDRSATTPSGEAPPPSPAGPGASDKPAADAAAAAAARKAAGEALAGKWLSVGDNEAPGYHPGYLFAPDGRYVPLTQGGQPIPKAAGGTWSVLKSRTDARDQSIEGELEMKGAPTEQVRFEIEGRVNLRLLVPAPQGKGSLIPLRFRREE
jgi:hypothetical protein